MGKLCCWLVADPRRLVELGTVKALWGTVVAAVIDDENDGGNAVQPALNLLSGGEKDSNEDVLSST